VVEQAGHVGVVEVAVRVDQSRHENHFAQVEYRAGMPRPNGTPTPCSRDAISDHHNCTIFNRRTPDWQDDAGAQDDWMVDAWWLLVGWHGRARFPIYQPSSLRY
jgi:hypothetical protein